MTEITLWFEGEYCDERKPIVIERNRTVFDLLMKFLKEVNQVDKYDILEFYVDIHYLNAYKDQIISKCKFLKNNTRIRVSEISKVIGGGCVQDFCDVSQNIYKDKDFCDKAPDWAKVTKGLNIDGKCSYKNCKAYDKTVTCRLGMFPNGFNLMSDFKQIRCPICNKNFHGDTPVFSSCQYKFEGSKIDENSGEYEDYITKYVSTPANGYRKFDEYKSGMVTWGSLIIYTKPL